MKNVSETDMDKNKIISLRMERQYLSRKAGETEYLKLYRDTQPGQNVYWHGFGQPPTLSFRADFDDLAYNGERQYHRQLIKGRFSGGNLGWIIPEDLELFASLYKKPLTEMSAIQRRVLETIEQLGPITIQQIKEETGLLVKEITPALHRLQEAFLVYEDQYDGEWDRGWYRFQEMFPDCNTEKYSCHEALKIVLKRFAFRHVVFDTAMAKSFYRLPEKKIRAAAEELTAEGCFVKVRREMPAWHIQEACAKESKEASAGHTQEACAKGSKRASPEKAEAYMLREDEELLRKYQPSEMHFIYALHRNDFLVKSNEPVLREKFRPLFENLEYDHELLHFLLIDGEFHGACVGHFRNGPYDLNDVICDLPDAAERKAEIIEAIGAVNNGQTPQRFLGQPV